jgi:hypothetical protein
MGILSFLQRRKTARLAATLSGEVAQRSVGPVLARVKRRASSMRSSEARGYVRARSLEIVHRELAAMQKGHQKLSPELQTEIVSLATEAVIVRVMAELKGGPQEKRSVERRAA